MNMLEVIQFLFIAFAVVSWIFSILSLYRILKSGEKLGHNLFFVLFLILISPIVFLLDFLFIRD